jgi:guanylate kinase
MTLPQKRLGLLIVVSGPSGSGKTTLCRKAADAGEAIFSVSCTTRAPRAGEVDGKDYFFVTESEFQEKIKRGELFEHAHVHGRWYGTLKSFVLENLKRGVDVLLDIDVQGAAQVRACDDEILKKCHLDVFILPPSFEELRNRLAGRGTEDQAAFALRMTNAIAEMEHWPKYDYTLVSSTREEDATRFRAILMAERMRTSVWTAT